MENLISWVEIPSNNFERAVNFYNRVFKMDMKGIECDMEKMACFPTGEGAIFYQSDYKPAQSGVIVSLLVPDSIEETLQRVEENGGEIRLPKTKIEAEGRGYFALFIDSEGSLIGLYEKL